MTKEKSIDIATQASIVKRGMEAYEAAKERDWVGLSDELLMEMPKQEQNEQHAKDAIAWMADTGYVFKKQEQVEPIATKNWEGAEYWMPLAWELCADECGEDACNELIFEGGPIPELWGDRWLKYEDEAKRLIALVYKHTKPQQRKPLTAKQIDEIPFALFVPDQDGMSTTEALRKFARAIESAHGINKE